MRSPSGGRSRRSSCRSSLSTGRPRWNSPRRRLPRPRAAGDALSLIDPDQLRLVNGQIDIAAIERIEQPFVDVQTALDDLDASLDDVVSPWLVAPLQDRLVELDDDIDAAKPRLDNVVMAVQVAPAMLGADGERRYFIAFTTPAETRGLGGVMDNSSDELFLPPPPTYCCSSIRGCGR